MKKGIIFGVLLLTITNTQLSAQAIKPQQPVKTGNEWKMPSDVFKRSRSYADNLQKYLGLDSVQTKKVYDAYLANTKPLDEISMAQVGEIEKAALIKENKVAFNGKLKAIFSASQYSKYLNM